MIPGEKWQRLGLLLPPGNVMMEMEFNRWLPPHVTVHGSRLRKSESTISLAQVQIIADSAVEAAWPFKMARAHLIVFGCTIASLFLGKGWDQRLGSQIQDATGIPTVTTATGVAQALHALGITRAAVVTPYPDELNERVKAFVVDQGIEVVTVKSFRCKISEEIPVIEPEEVYRIAREADHPKADGIFISCTNLATFDIIERLERDTGKPVVTSNQASLWLALKGLQAGPPVKAAGRLFQAAARRVA